MMTTIRLQLVLGAATVAMLPLGTARAQDINRRVPASRTHALTPSEREQAASSTIERWAGTAEARGYRVDAWRTHVMARIERAADEALVRAQRADSYGEMVLALTGRNPDLPEILGDNSSDLVFTPINPCRIMDTRFGTGSYAGLRAAGSTTSISTSIVSQIAAQGGNPAGCPAVPTDAGALAYTLTVVDYTSGAFVTVFPFGAPRPLASTINMGPGTSPTPIANSSVVQQCYLCGDEISFYVEGAATNVIIDAIGYYNPSVMPVGTTSNTSATLVFGDNYILSGVNIVPARALTCVVTADVAWSNNGDPPAVGQAGMRTARRNVTAGTNSNDSGWVNYVGGLGDWSGTASKTSVWQLSTGTTYQFGCDVFANGEFVGDVAYCSVTWSCR